MARADRTIRLGQSAPPPPPPVAGAYAHLAPIYATLPTGITFNPDTGRYDGTVMDTTEPVWAVTDGSLVDTGNPVTNMANLQAKLNTVASTATSNTRILLPAGARFQGQLLLPANTTGQWIGLYTSAYGSLPPWSPGASVGKAVNRVGPGNIAQMPEFYATTANQPVIMVGASATQRYVLRGLYCSNRLDQRNDGSMIWLCDPQPSRIICAQLAVDGGNWDRVRRAIFLGGTHLAVIDSYASVLGQPQDCQHVLVGAGLGPYKYTNNWSSIGGNSENFMAGGFNSIPLAQVPSDIEIRGNYFTKPLAYGWHKNHVELKVGKRVLIEGNVYGDHNRIDGSQNFYVFLKITEPAVTQDVVIANQRFGPLKGMVGFQGALAPGTVGSIDVINNLAEPLTGFRRTFDIGTYNTDGRLARLAFRWNTVCGMADQSFHTSLFILDGSRTIVTVDTLTVTDNIFVSGNGFYEHYFAIGRDGGTVFNGGGGERVLFGFTDSAGTNVTYTRNLVTVGQNFAGPGVYERSLRTGIPDTGPWGLPTVGFVNPGAGNFALSPASPGYAAGEGGRPLGADSALIAAITAGVV